MSKKIAKITKINLPAGQAKPGPKLSSAGILMPKFCTEFNAKTADRNGETVPVVITAFEDKSFEFVIKTSPSTELLRKAAGISKGSANPKQTVGSVTREQVRKIAEYKLPDLNCYDVEAAMRIIEATAKSMGLKVVD